MAKVEEPFDDPRVQAVVKALVEKRDRWLDLAYNKLDNVVLDAYAWPHDITNDQILEHLLALNLERSATREEEL